MLVRCRPGFQVPTQHSTKPMHAPVLGTTCTLCLSALYMYLFLRKLLHKLEVSIKTIGNYVQVPLAVWLQALKGILFLVTNILEQDVRIELGQCLLLDHFVAE